MSIHLQVMSIAEHTVRGALSHRFVAPAVVVHFLIPRRFVDNNQVAPIFLMLSHLRTYTQFVYCFNDHASYQLPKCSLPKICFHKNYYILHPL